MDSNSDSTKRDLINATIDSYYEYSGNENSGILTVADPGISDSTRIDLINAMIDSYYEYGGAADAVKDCGMLDQLIGDIQCVASFGKEG